MIRKTDLEFVREPLAAPFGFKGRYLSELWQTVALVESDRFRAVCPAVESVLWSDAGVFSANPPAASSAMMLLVTGRALKMLEGERIERPDAVVPELVPELMRYAAAVCGRPVAETFVLNALVGVDYALWMLYALENGISDFDRLIPEAARAALHCRQDALAHIPLISYDVGEDALRAVLDGGTALLKIKIGRMAAPPGADRETDMREMLAWDCRRLSEIHAVAGQYETDLTRDGKVHYYLDANGRYDTLERLNALLEHAEKIGALGRISLLEEPFEAENERDVHGLPVVVNADESAHSVADVRRRLALGYRAVALKPIAKTMSVSFEMAACIHAAGGQCLCADLTVNPLLALWNMQFAARTEALDGLRCGCVEVNGDQNYARWEALCALLPDGMRFQAARAGRFALDEDFYAKSGLLFGANGYARYFAAR